MESNNEFASFPIHLDADALIETIQQQIQTRKINTCARLLEVRQMLTRTSVRAKAKKS